MRYIQWWTSLVAQMVKNCLQYGRPGFDLWFGKMPWRRKVYPPQYSGMENSMDCIVHGVTKSWTQLSDFHFHFELSLALPVFGIAMKTDLFQAIVEFSKFAGILSAALYQIHLLGFEIAHLELHHLHWLCA